MSRCDSAAMVPNTSELLPEPETPVNTVSRRFGSSTSTSLRLLTRAPWTRIRSWRSAMCSSVDGASDLAVLMDLRWSGADGSAQFLDADHVARGVAEGAVPDAVGLLGRLLHDLGVVGLDLLEDRVEVAGGQQDPAVGALGHHLGDGAAFVVGD